MQSGRLCTPNQNELLKLCDEDHFDLEKIMSTVDQQKFSPNMQLLLEQQEMTLSRKAGSYR